MSRYCAPRTIIFLDSMGQTVCHRSCQEPEAIFFDIRHGRAARNGVVVTASRDVIRVLMLFCAARGRPVGTRELCDLIYGPDEDGGPDDAEGTVRGLIMKAKHAGGALGLAIHSHGYQGCVAHDIFFKCGRRAMKFSDAQLDDLRQRFPVDAEVRKHVALRAVRQGKFPFSGPCPLHSQDPKARDSTSFACDHQVWVCTECGGGDIFELVGRLNGLKPRQNGGADFIKAVELVGGVRELSDEEKKALDEKRAADRLANENERNSYRDAERGRAWDIYNKYSVRLLAPEAQAGRDYLRNARGLDFPPNVWLRFAPAMRFYVPDKPKHRQIHEGPALTLQLQRAGAFVGVHITWFDLARPKGKPLIIDPKTGDQPRNKKMRGTKAGAHGDLTGWIKEPETLVLGEGIEKVLAVWSALNAGGRDLARTGLWSACDLGNLGGPAADSVPHPTLTTPTGRRKHVAGIVPDREKPAIEIPDSVRRLVLIGDSTSDPFQTQCAVARAAARYARPGREVVCAWSPEGQDFDDLLREASNA